MKLHFVSWLQFMFCIVFAVMAMVCLIGAFYNNFHVLTFGMSSVMTCVTYKEKNW
ncbi:hypothetical protein [Parabacteroides pacaensis]|uniref:hypothetical protein n=1 Tax=Parabacteroides pacaensis TaxID=2086575 RepID=UPI00131E057B|nr:hypothetical protein [Parabacteroides pacaensis]